MNAYVYSLSFSTLSQLAAHHRDAQTRLQGHADYDLARAEINMNQAERTMQTKLLRQKQCRCANLTTMRESNYKIC